MRTDQFIDQAHAPGRLCAQIPCAEHELHGVGGASLLDTAGAAAKTRVDTQFYFRKTKPCMFHVTGNAIIKCQGKLDAATEAKPVNDNNLWEGQSFDAVKQTVNLPNAVAGRISIIISIEFTHVRADNKGPRLGRLQHKPGGSSCFQAIDD